MAQEVRDEPAMTICVLRVHGDAFQPEKFLASTGLRPESVFVKGEPAKRRTKPSRTSGFQCDILDGTASLDEATSAARSFLEKHFDDLTRLAQENTIESRFLDFYVEYRIDFQKTCVQIERLPAELLLVAGQLKIDVVLSIFPPFEPPGINQATEGMS